MPGFLIVEMCLKWHEICQCIVEPSLSAYKTVSNTAFHIDIFYSWFYTLRYWDLDLEMNPMAYAPTTSPQRPSASMDPPLVVLDDDEPPFNPPPGNFSMR